MDTPLLLWGSVIPSSTAISNEKKTSFLRTLVTNQVPELLPLLVSQPSPFSDTSSLIRCSWLCRDMY